MNATQILPNLKKEISIKQDSLKQQLRFQYRNLLKPPFIRLEGIKVPMGSHLSPLMIEAIYKGYYESQELKTIKAHLKPHDVVMEVGAGIGLVSSFCAKKIGSERVFAYEANPALKTPILEAYKLNNVSPSLEICLIGEDSGEKTFYVHQDFWASSTIPRGKKTQAVKVPVKSFNAEVERIQPTFVIIDIEGGEYELLQYANLEQVQKVAIEVHEKVIGKEKVDFVKNRLTDLGFQLDRSVSSQEELFYFR